MRRATTHTDLELRARRAGIPVRVVHNASIMNAVGVCGLQLYRFGEVRHPVFGPLLEVKPWPSTLGLHLVRSHLHPAHKHTVSCQRRSYTICLDLLTS